MRTQCRLRKILRPAKVSHIFVLSESSTYAFPGTSLIHSTVTPVSLASVTHGPDLMPPARQERLRMSPDNSSAYFFIASQI